ncbi:hypothetical protein ABZV78_07655 [Micromonospora sp. NPDC004540]|uniref:hypothetical protein n=1 Tax=Micromonospora sp. NPDC004540 TaxID=3154457 RepID=UPI0033AA231C
MKTFLRTTVVGGVFLAVLSLLAPTAYAALPTLKTGDYLQRRFLENQPPGTGRLWVKNSSGQILGSYELWAEVGTPRTMRMTQLCVHDELANGRGVVLRLMVKYGSNSSKDLGYFKGRADCYFGVQVTAPSDIWALDVDHGEDWSGTPYRYAGHYDRFGLWTPTTDLWPSFD